MKQKPTTVYPSHKHKIHCGDAPLHTVYKRSYCTGAIESLTYYKASYSDLLQLVQACSKLH